MPTDNMQISLTDNMGIFKLALNGRTFVASASR